MTLTHRCPVCLVRYPAPGEQAGGLPQPYVCLGGWPRYPSSLGEPEYHAPTATEPIPE